MRPLFERPAILRMFENELSIISKYSEYSFESPRKQYFSFPPDIISHLIYKPLSAEGLKKIYQTCKYFFARRQLLIFTSHGWWMKTELSGYAQGGRLKVYTLNKKVLFWFTNHLTLYEAFNLEPIYRCSLKSLTIYSSIISLSEFELLTSKNDSKIRDFIFTDSNILYSNGTNVSIDVIFQYLPNVKTIEFKSKEENFSRMTLYNLSKIKFVNSLEYIYLDIFNFSTSFFNDASLLCNFLKQNLSSPPHSVGILFIYGKNAQNIKNEFKALIDKILDDKKVGVIARVQKPS